MMQLIDAGADPDTDVAVYQTYGDAYARAKTIPATTLDWPSG